MAIYAKLFANLMLAWLAALFLVTWYKLWKAQSSITGILRASPTAEVRSERVQNVAAFAFVLGAYALNALRTPLDPDNPSLPDASPTLMMLLAGSNGIYLIKKTIDARLPAAGPASPPASNAAGRPAPDQPNRPH
ncbi:MAG TPA: hypothetical protein VF601_07810 [Beijerinckiaceae bacterium]|jgi:hypothetical protein